MGPPPPRSLLSSRCISTLSPLLPLPSFQKGPECSACLSRVPLGAGTTAPCHQLSVCNSRRAPSHESEGQPASEAGTPQSPGLPAPRSSRSPGAPSPAGLAHLERRRPPLAKQEERRHDGLRSRPARGHGPRRRTTGRRAGCARSRERTRPPRASSQSEGSFPPGAGPGCGSRWGCEGAPWRRERSLPCMVAQAGRRLPCTR